MSKTIRMTTHGKYISINNRLFLEKDAKLAVHDLSIQRGYGIFDFFITIDDRPIFIDDHLNRFYNSARIMRLEANPDREQLKRSILLLMEKNNIPNSSIKIILTGGYSEDGYAIGNPNLIIFQTHFKMENNNLENGTKLITYNYQREVPEAKTIDYLQAIWLQPYIQDNNADDVLYHHDGIVSECPRANFFIVTDKAIITPQSNILKGITRMKVLNMNLDGYVILEKDLNLSDLKNAKEAFITSTTRNISPIVSINGDQVGDGKIGIVTKQLNEKLFNLKLSVK